MSYLTKLVVVLQVAAGGLTDRVRALESERERGATAVEYGLLVALIAAVIVAAVTLFGTTISGIFTGVTGAI